MRNLTGYVVGVVLVFVFTGCISMMKKTWVAEPVGVIPGFNAPECVVHNKADNLIYVSNINSGESGYWADDGTGYISIAGPQHQVKVAQWIAGGKIHAPKGMCLLGDYLYFTDNTRLMRCSLLTGEELAVVSSGFVTANDLATDGKYIWVSDTGAGRVYCVYPDGKRRAVPSPRGVNGITFSKGSLFAVSGNVHEVYELDPRGNLPPVSFGVAGYFTSLDGIEVLSDGAFLVSDLTGNKIFTIHPDRKTVKLLAEVSSPADIGLDRKRQLLYVPNRTEGSVSVYRIQLR